MSELERLAIESAYFRMVTGDRLRLRQALELQSAANPRNPLPLLSVGTLYGELGQREKALECSQQGLSLSPDDSGSYDLVFRSLLRLNRMREAKATFRDAEVKHLDSPHLHLGMYQVAFAEADSAGMSQQLAWAATHRDALVPLSEAATEAYAGKVRKARDLFRRSVESISPDDLRSLGRALVRSAMWEALLGNPFEARTEASKAILLKTDSHVRFLAALDMALSGDSTVASTLAEQLNRDFPEDTLVQLIYLPEIHAQLALNRNEPSTAIEILTSTTPYEMGVDALMSAYLRGQAYIATHNGMDAAAQFQKVIAHPEIVQNSVIGALAHLQLGRAYVVLGDTSKAKAAYQDFLSLWKDTDTDLPILRQAQQEYARLNRANSH